ncbi:MAG: SPOR domain-containing protein [Prevotellaceae bacterium]|jgi:cell division protein FtsN|nr:SPOR domain-containing protein [Prevotellaceae bacterium]
MIQNKLKSLVLSNRRLIIPTIGAFLVNQQGVITFSSFLKYDDGLLTKLLCEQENLSEDDAKHIITGFAHEVLDVINNGNRFSIPNFGYFAADNHSNVTFTVENAAAEPINPNPYIPPVVETPVFTNTEEPQNFFNTPFTENPIFNTNQNNDFSFPNNDVNTRNTVQKEKKSKAGYWILTIILVIIAVLLLLYLFSNDFKKTVNSLFSDKPRTEIVKDTVTNTTPPVVDTATVVQDTTVVTQQQPERTQTSGTVASSTLNGKYQVIAGCYLERDIADKFVRELKEKGYEARIPDHLSGEWIVVIVYESDDENDATRVKDQFVAAGYDDAYIRRRSGGIVSSSSSSTSSSNVSSSAQSASYPVTTSKLRSKYQTVVGCFLEASNAQKCFNEAKSKGLDARISEQKGEWTLVVVCETNDLNEAERVKEQCVSAGYSDAWIRGQ